MNRYLLAALMIVGGLTLADAEASADTIAEWTFPSGTSVSVVTADTGAGSLTPSPATYYTGWYLSSANSPLPPADDGTESLGVGLFNGHGVRFDVTIDASDFTDLHVAGEFSRVGNPSLREWGLTYSIDGGSSFTAVGESNSWNYGWNELTWDLSGISALDGQSSVMLRFSSGMPNTVADWYTSGAVDNLLITGTATNPVPEPSSIVLLGTSALGLLVVARRRGRCGDA